MSNDDFKQQQRSFAVNGYARNPNLAGVDGFSGAALPYVGDVHAAHRLGGTTVGEQAVTKAEVRALKRKRKAKGELGVFDEEPIEGDDAPPPESNEYKGPWADWEVEQKAINAYEGPEEEEYELARRTKRPIVERSKREVGFGEEKSVFHGTSACAFSICLVALPRTGKELRDYQGRTYMSIPRDVDVNLEPEEPGQQQCFIPKKCIHTWSGHTRGVSAVRTFPGSGHLLLSASMDTRIKVRRRFR
jgi:pre-mRNA-processing factor 17